MITSSKEGTITDNGIPRVLLIARILTVIETVRLAGLLLFSEFQAGIFPAYFAIPFGIGDVFIGLTAIPFAYLLGKGGPRRYALAIAWNFVGLIDLLYAFAVAAYGGVTQAISTYLPSVLVVVPISILVHVMILALLLTKPTSRFFMKNQIP